MKKQLITGAMVLSMMVGTATTAMAADNLKAIPLEKSSYSIDSIKATSREVVESSLNPNGNMFFEKIDLNNGSTDATTQAMSLDFKNFKPLTEADYTAQIKESKIKLATSVVNGEITQAEADQTIIEMENLLEAIKNGADIKIGSITDDNGKVEIVTMIKAIATTPSTPTNK